MAPVERSTRARHDAEVVKAIATHFDGDAQLYAAFAEACAAQFAIDATRGRTACDRGDLAGLRRLGHDLGSALLVLGHADARSAAVLLEQCALAGDVPAAVAAWKALEPRLRQINKKRND